MSLTTEEDAIAYFERLRWPSGPECPRCGSRKPYRIRATHTSRSRGARKGLYSCRKCRRQFSVSVKSILAGRHVPFLDCWRAVQILEVAPSTTPFKLSQLLGITPKSGVTLHDRLTRHDPSCAISEALLRRRLIRRLLVALRIYNEEHSNSRWPSHYAGTWMQIVNVLRGSRRPLSSREIAMHIDITSCHTYLPEMVVQNAIQRARRVPQDGHGKLYVYWVE